MPRRLGPPLKPRRITRYEQTHLKRYNINLPLHTVFHLRPGGLKIMLETRRKEMIDPNISGRTKRIILYLLNERFWKL